MRATLAGEQHLTVDPTVLPSVAPLQRVPFAVNPKLKTELERLTELVVIASVDEPTDWVSNPVIATKDLGELRLCLDPKQLSKALQKERYPLPVIEDDLAKAKVFTKVNARNGYWHVQLDHESSLLTSTHRLDGFAGDDYRLGSASCQRSFRKHSTRHSTDLMVY